MWSATLYAARLSPGARNANTAPTPRWPAMALSIQSLSDGLVITARPRTTRIMIITVFIVVALKNVLSFTPLNSPYSPLTILALYVTCGISPALRIEYFQQNAPKFFGLSRGRFR